MRAVVAVVLASSLFVSSAFAAADTGPLAPGKPAGVKQADIEAGGVLLALGVIGLAAGIALIASGTQGSNNASTGTTTTTTT
jgi:hypothetical protein